MVDRVYRSDLPRLRVALEALKSEFSERAQSKTDWTRLRIEPLLSHVKSLERVLESKEFSQEAYRLRKGVVFFHSDLVYLRLNVKELKALLESEKPLKKRKGLNR